MPVLTQWMVRIYDDLNECEAICNSVSEDSWNCVNNACVDPMDGSTGICDDYNECEQKHIKVFLL